MVGWIARASKEKKGAQENGPYQNLQRKHWNEAKMKDDGKWDPRQHYLISWIYSCSSQLGFRNLWQKIQCYHGKWAARQIKKVEMHKEIHCRWEDNRTPARTKVLSKWFATVKQITGTVNVGIRGEAKTGTPSPGTQNPLSIVLPIHPASLLNSQILFGSVHEFLTPHSFPLPETPASTHLINS